MELTLQSFLLFLRNLASFFRRRWDRSTRKLLYVLALLRSRFSPRHPKKRNDASRDIESRSTKPSPTTVICASRLPPLFTPIAGFDDTPIISSPSSISIKVRQPTVLDPEDTLAESHKGDNTDHQDVDRYFQMESRSISGSLNFASHHNEPDPTYSYRPSPNLNGAESAARGYLPENPSPRPSSPALSARTLSVTGSVAPRVYRASRPTTRVRRPSPMISVPRRGDRSTTPTSVRQGMHGTHPDVSVPKFPQPESHTVESIYRDPNDMDADFGPPLSSPPKGKLRPIIGIGRYEKHKVVTIENVVKSNVCTPVTTQFLR